VIDAVAVAERVPDMVGVPLALCDAVPLSVPVFELVSVCKEVAQIAQIAVHLEKGKAKKTMHHLRLRVV
jgi:hypothetical protein